MRVFLALDLARLDFANVELHQEWGKYHFRSVILHKLVAIMKKVRDDQTEEYSSTFVLPLTLKTLDRYSSTFVLPLILSKTILIIIKASTKSFQMIQFLSLNVLRALYLIF
jgi:hypothetical protein